MKLYLYGIIDSCGQLKEPVYGLEDSCVYNIPYCDTGAVVSEISHPVIHSTEDAILKHEAVVEKLMTNFTILPVKFQTVINDRAGLLSMMQSLYRNFKNNLERLRDKREFGVKVLWPAEKIKTKISNDFKLSRKKIFDSELSQARKFMAETFQKYKLDEEFRQIAENYIKIIDSSINRYAVEKKVRKLKTDKLLLDAVYLVEKSLVNNFKETFERSKKEQPDFKYLFSGPWPAYNFIILSKQDRISNKSVNDQNMTGVNNL